MATVEQVTSTMANTAINSTAAAPEAINTVGQKALDEGRRLYIGNLAYATTEENLKAFFEGYLFEGTNMPVNPKTHRPVGYAFVDVSTVSEAKRAIDELSGKEVLGRKVSVQIAHKHDAVPEAVEGTSGGEGISGGEGRRRSSGRGRGRARGRGGRGGRGDRNVLPLTDTTAETANATNIKDEGVDGKDAKLAEPRTPRPPKQRGPPADGIASKTKVMVANLPYNLNDEQLKELFAAYNPTASKIALRPIPRFMVKKLEQRNEPRKGRGFGFVTLESEEMQQKAIAEMNTKLIDGREIAVKVAVDSPGKEDKDGEAGDPEAIQENGVAPATEIPAAA